VDASNGTDGLASPVPPADKSPGWIAAGLVVAAVLALMVLSFIEARWLKAQPWSTAFRTVDYVVDDPSAIGTWSRELSLEQSVGESAFVGYIQRDLIRMNALEAAAQKDKAPDPALPVNPFDTSRMLDLSYLPRASLIMIDLPASSLEPLLESGRLPEAGKNEVLGGALTSSRDLEIDGQIFSVVGKLRPQVRGFVKTYVLPADDALRAAHFGESSGAKQGSVIPDGLGRVAVLVPELVDTSIEQKPILDIGPVPTHPLIAWGIWLSLMLAAAGASLGFITLFRRLAQSRYPLLAVTMRETVLRPGLLWGLHIILFGAFFGAMFIGMRDPELNYLFTEYAAHTFTDGGLKYVGDAYQSGSIPRAAHATFHNNYVIQTLFLSAGTSLLVPLFLGVLKTMASFLVVGFAMAPLWTETASGMTYHVITLVLELPPYILASFGVSVWSLCVCRFFWSPVRVWYLGDKALGEPIIQEAALQLPRGLIVLVGCTLFSGLFLYIAAWYEATTLILFR